MCTSSNSFIFSRYEDEINKRNDFENNFVLIKKVCSGFLTYS